ncbi:hypothetical protein Tco_0019132 [Tanacetum coccineum]
MLSLRERMELDLEARLMGETLVLNRSLDPFFGDYIELNDLNVPLELRRYQIDDLMPTIEEGEGLRHDKKIRLIVPTIEFSCMIDFEVLERYGMLIVDEGIWADVIFVANVLREALLLTRSRLESFDIVIISVELFAHHFLKVMAISTVSNFSWIPSEGECLGTKPFPSGRVLWFGRIPTTVPVTTPTIDPTVIHDDTSLIPTETPTISPITSTIPPTTPTTHYTYPFIHTDSSNNDTPDTPPSPTHEIPPIKVTPPTGQILPAPFDVRRRRVHMMNARKRVGPLPTHLLAVRHSVDYSSSDYFTSDDSSRDSPLDSSSKTSSDSSSDALSDSSSGHSSSNHSSPALPSGMGSSHQLCSSVLSIPHSSAAITERPSHSYFTGPSHKRSRSPTTSVPVSSPIPGALSSVHADLLPPRKRIRSSDYATDLEDCSDGSSESFVPRETSLRDDIAEIDECVAYADSLRAEGIDDGVVVKTVAQEEVETSAKGTVEVRDDRVMHPLVSDDIPEPAQEEGGIEVIESIQRDQGHKIITTGQQSAVQSKRISELERDNIRLRGILDVASKRVTRFQHRESVGAARNLEPLAEGGDEQGGENGDDYEGRNGGGDGNGKGNERVNRNGNGGGNGNGNSNGNGNGNGGGNGYENHNVNFRGFMPVARECTYQDFLKCHPLNFKGAEGVFGLTRWFEKMETVFHISNCPKKNQVKYATCTLLDSALTWWNTHKRTFRIDAAYAMTWT